MAKVGAVTQNRMVGAYIGLAVGDALGGPYEFMQAKEIIEAFVPGYTGGGWLNLDPGEWTDDTAMARAMLHGITKEMGSINPTSVMEEFSAWLKDNRHCSRNEFLDCGNQTAKAIDYWQQHGTFLLSPTASGNGSLMRLAPAVIATAHLPLEEAIIACQMTSLPTHNSPEVFDCVAVLTAAIRAGILGLHPARLIKEALKLDDVITTEIVTEKAKDWIDVGDFRNQPAEAFQNQSGYCVSTLESALWAVYGADCFEHALYRAILLGGDVDTVAAVTGQIAGARFGYSSIPDALRDGLLRQDGLYNEVFALIQMKEARAEARA